MLVTATIGPTGPCSNPATADSLNGNQVCKLCKKGLQKQTYLLSISQKISISPVYSSDVMNQRRTHDASDFEEHLGDDVEYRLSDFEEQLGLIDKDQ